MQYGKTAYNSPAYFSAYDIMQAARNLTGRVNPELGGS